jgi:hypothetical protein
VTVIPVIFGHQLGSVQDAGIACGADVTSPIDSRVQWHILLLNLAGWLPDEVVASAREALAAGRENGVAHLIAEAIITGLVPFTADNAARLSTLLAAQGEDPSLVDAGIRENPGPPPFTFLPVPPWGIGPNNLDDIDQAVLSASNRAGVVALWRVWRYPSHGLQASRRVFLAETSSADGMPAVMGHLQEALRRAGEPSPQIEVFTAQTELSDYHQAARAMAELLWRQEEVVQ